MQDRLDASRHATLNFLGLILAALIGAWALLSSNSREDQFEAEKQRLQAQIAALQQRGPETADIERLQAEVQRLEAVLNETHARADHLKSQLEDLNHRQSQPEVQRAAIPETSTRSASQPVATIREQGFTFDLQECRGEGSAINCDLVMTNRMADRWIWLRERNSYIIDNGGNGCRLRDTSFEWGNLPYEVPFRVALQFTNCPRSISTLSYMELHFQLGSPISNDKFAVPFRQIPVVVH